MDLSLSPSMPFIYLEKSKGQLYFSPPPPEQKYIQYQNNAWAIMTEKTLFFTITQLYNIHNIVIQLFYGWKIHVLLSERK